MKCISLLFLLIVPFWSFCQRPNDERVLSQILDTLFKKINFPFFYDTLIHYDVSYNLRHLRDTLEFIDPETYESTYQLGLVALIKDDSLNLEEARLNKKRFDYPDGIVFLSRPSKSTFHCNNVDLKKEVKIESYPNLKEMDELPDPTYNLNKIGKYNIIQYSKENLHQYKYAMKLVFLTSGVVWDSTNRYCVVECGTHYSDNTIYPTGFGILVILENKNDILKIVKFIGLWEE